MGSDKLNFKNKREGETIRHRPPRIPRFLARSRPPPEKQAGKRQPGAK